MAILLGLLSLEEISKLSERDLDILGSIIYTQVREDEKIRQLLRQHIDEVMPTLNRIRESRAVEKGNEKK